MLAHQTAQPCYLLPLLLHPWTPCPSNGKKTLKDSVPFHILQARLCGCTTLFSPPVIFFMRRWWWWWWGELMVLLKRLSWPPSQKWSKDLLHLISEPCCWSFKQLGGFSSPSFGQVHPSHHPCKVVMFNIHPSREKDLHMQHQLTVGQLCTQSSLWKWHLTHPLLSWCKQNKSRYKKRLCIINLESSM